MSSEQTYKYVTMNYEYVGKRSEKLNTGYVRVDSDGGTWSKMAYASDKYLSRFG